MMVTSGQRTRDSKKFRASFQSLPWGHVLFPGSAGGISDFPSGQEVSIYPKLTGSWQHQLDSKNKNKNMNNKIVLLIIIIFFPPQ